MWERAKGVAAINTRIRSLLLTTVAVCCATASHAGYTARLYFRNETKGTANDGPLIASPGDVVSIVYSFHGDSVGINRWSRLQITMDLYANPVMSLAEANTWKQTVNAAFPKPPYLNRVLWQPSDGTLRDNATNPGDPRSVIATPRGLYAQVFSDLTGPSSKDVDVKVFQFTVQANGALEWKYRGRNTSYGLSTRMTDRWGGTVDIADNWLVVEQTAYVSGHVDFQYLAHGVAPPSTVVMRVTTEGQSAFYEQPLALDQNGDFRLLLPAGQHQLSIRHTHWLRRTLHVDTSSGQPAQVDFELLNGDAYVDGRVDIQDIVALVVTLGTPGDGLTDLDMDGLVGLNDISLVLLNYTLEGDS